MLYSCIYIYILTPLFAASIFLNSNRQVLPTVALYELFVGVPLALAQTSLLGSFSSMLISWSITIKPHFNGPREFILPNHLSCYVLDKPGERESIFTMEMPYFSPPWCLNNGMRSNPMWSNEGKFVNFTIHGWEKALDSHVFNPLAVLLMEQNFSLIFPYPDTSNLLHPYSFCLVYPSSLGAVSICHSIHKRRGSSLG